LLLKVPNIIKVDPLPYDPEQTDIEPEEVDEGGKKKVRPNDINVIRWRYRCATAVEGVSVDQGGSKDFLEGSHLCLVE
jgi:hypothetical protein